MKEFQSPGAFARYLAEMRGKLPEAQKAGLEAAAKLVLEEVRAEIGHYQGAVNGLPEWQELAGRTKKDRAAHGFPEDEPLLRTGGMRDSYTSEVKGDTATVGSDDPVAAYQEFGTPNARFPIPPRPVLGGSLFRRADDAVKAAVEPTIRLLEGK